MLVVISSQGDSLDSSTSPVFGRCPWFVFYDTSKDEVVEAVQNPAASAPGGAGVQAAQFVVSKGAKAVITGHVGPNAFSILDGAGVEIYTGASGTVQEAVTAFKDGKLTKAEGSTAGVGSGQGRGMASGGYYPARGMGRGRGMGGGRGMGWGRGRGRGWGPPSVCVCPSCGATVPHTPGVPCRSVQCPKCGMVMMRGD